MTKDPFAYWTAARSAPSTKKICAGSTMRVSRTVAVTWPSVNSGYTSSITVGAATHPMTTRRQIPAVMGRMIALSAAHPPSSSPAARYRAKIGMNVIDRNPPARR